MPRLRRWFTWTMVLTLGLMGCARDDQGHLRSRLNDWFQLGQTRYFESKARCTVAVYQLDNAAPRGTIAVHMDLPTAKNQFRIGQFAAVRIADRSPHDIVDALLLNGDGTFGREALAAVAQAGPCYKHTVAEQALFRAMTRQGATLAYDRKSEGVIVLDPDSMELFYVAGDVW